jgi:nucleotide-binding universal stress UspA family protein
MKEDPMLGSVICGLDGSESAKQAARVARGLSASLGLRLVFVHVVDSADSHEKVSAVVKRLRSLAAGASEVDCGASWVVDAGGVADRLVATAKEEQASLIVVGSHDEPSSQLADLSRRSPCPVVVVPSRDEGSRNGEHQISNTSDFAGGIVRLGLGYSEDGRGPDLDGGIVRFNFGSGRPQH